MAPKSAASLRAHELHQPGKSRDFAMQTLRTKFPHLKARRDINKDLLGNMLLNKTLPQRGWGQEVSDIAQGVAERFGMTSERTQLRLHGFECARSLA